MMLKPSLASLLIVLSGKTFAEFSIPGIATSPINALYASDKTLAQTGISQNIDDISSDQDIHDVQLSTVQIHETKVWGLTADEEKRYVLLMQNKSAIYYDGLRQTPIDILGINARTQQERDHFAELSALFEAQKVSKNIAWNNAFYVAYNKLFKDVPVVGKTDLSRYSPRQYRPISLEPNDNLYFFIKPTDAVKIILLSLSEALKSTASTHLHIMLLNTNDIGIQTWASRHQIPKEMVTSGQVSLNHGELNFNALQGVNKKIPLLLLARNNTSTVVDLGRF
jgi:integrating conjugative element protein (TIGR03759 family)